MRAGSLRHLVSIQQQSSVRNALGERVDVWTDVDTVWARVHPVSGRELLRSNLKTGQLDYLITIRFRADINSTQRLVLEDGTTLDIDSVVNVNGRSRELELACVERRPD